MNADRLLEWMTHVGSGPWDAFRDAVDEVDDVIEREDPHAWYRTLRMAMSDLGHVDFFVGGSRRWQMRQPVLAGLADDESAHLFTGGRTSELLDKLEQRVTGNRNGIVTIHEDGPGPSRVKVTGEPEFLREVAEELRIQYLPKASVTLAGAATSIRDVLESTGRDEEPINWDVISWSFREARWVAGRGDRTIREYSNRHGMRRYLLNVDRDDSLREVEKHTGMYCAALIRRERIVNYSHTEQTLRVPVWAPLPAEHARAACLARGVPASRQDGSLVFKGVDWDTAATLLASLGQVVPTPVNSP